MKRTSVSTPPRGARAHPLDRPPGPASAAEPKGAGQHVPPVASTRLGSVDVLRGLVMVLMALDHSHYFTLESASEGLSPASAAAAAHFLTRWITHLCAPAFMLLAGVGAYLYGRKRQDKGALSRYLATRGLWLIALEFTLVAFLWSFHPRPAFVPLRVLWAIGVSMVALAGLIHLPFRALTSVTAALILGHNLLDGVRAESLGALEVPWRVLHQQGDVMLASGLKIRVLYPLIPWPAVMALGYLLGPVLLREPEARRRLLARAGAATTAVYGLAAAVKYAAAPASAGTLQRLLYTLDAEKYPPSLLFLLMTLGPALLLLAWLDRKPGPLGHALLTFGRVPLFFYVAHLGLLHAAGLALAVSGALPPSLLPPGVSHLVATYAVWVAGTLALYPVCRWFAGVKRTSRNPWISYL